MLKNTQLIPGWLLITPEKGIMRWKTTLYCEARVFNNKDKVFNKKKTIQYW